MLTETPAEDVTDSGAKRPSGSVSVEPGTMSIIASFLARRALVIADDGGPPSMSSDELLEFAKPSVQNAAVLDLIEKVRPSGIDLDRWLSWLDGGMAPVKAGCLDRPTDGERTASITLDRRVRAVIKIEKQIAAVKQSAARKMKQAEDLESELVELRAVNSAIVEFVLLDRLVGVIKSHLPIGPLWTLARAIGAHDPEGDVDVSNMSASLINTYALIAEKREADTRAIFECLDFMAGDAKFEEKLRDSILNLVGAHKAEIEERKRAGEKARPMAKIKTSMNAVSRAEVARVVGSLPGA